MGLGDDVVGVSYECDYPPEARGKPVVVRTRIDQDALDSRAIDERVRASLRRRESLYDIDVEALKRLRPDLIVTQQLCDVCAVGSSQVTQALGALPHQPQVLALHPHTLEDALEDLRRVGEATQRAAEAERILRSLRSRLARVEAAVAGAPRPRAFCLEWLDPPMASGHWVPEQVERSGGFEVLGRARQPSHYVTPEEIAAAQPEVLVLMPCGFSIERTQREAARLTAAPWWRALPAARSGRVYLVDGPALFNRPGPRLVDGVELLAALFHHHEKVPGTVVV